MRYQLTYRAQTALKAEEVEAGGLRVLRGEDLLVFEPTEREGRYQRGFAVPLRFVESVTELTGDGRPLDLS